MERLCYLSQAKQILENAKETVFSKEKRREVAIELAALMLKESRRIQLSPERRQQIVLARMMKDPIGKAFTTSMTDQCFRSTSHARTADQLIFLIQKFGIPKFLSPLKKMQLFFFRYLGRCFAFLAIPHIKRMLRNEMRNVILPGEAHLLSKHIQKRRQDGVHINLNRLGEAILGEGEVNRRINRYLSDLANPEIEYLSIKISTLFSQISLIGREETLSILIARLKSIYRAAKENFYCLPDGKQVPKFVNLDMEEYRDLHLTVDLFKRVLDEDEFFGYFAGIVLQAYLPDAFLIQQELTSWAMKRVDKGGAPIKIRFVKGANLAMEKVEAALKGWPQAPYLSKLETDANYKRMLAYASEIERARAVHIGLGSHNLFDIAYAMLLKAEKGLYNYMTFEMLEGMAGPICRVVQSLEGSVLLYCPVATSNEFQNAVAYLMRRLDENTAQENFLRHAFDMLPGTVDWQNQANLFSLACHQANEVNVMSRRQESRFNPLLPDSYHLPFKNESDTDWTMLENTRWAQTILLEWSKKSIGIIPLVIGAQEVSAGLTLQKKMDPSYPKKELYQYVLANEMEMETALQTAENAMQSWAQYSLEQRLILIDQAAYQLRCHRGDLIGAMVADTAKTLLEADVEVSEAIDFAAYYRRSVEEWHLMEDIQWIPKGTVLVAPPWNFPCSIAAGGILGALSTGNTVIFKPAPEAVLVGWHLVNALWQAGISREVLQFFCCADDPIGTRLIQDPRIALVILTGSTTTAKQFLKLRPGLDLIAETGGKNALIITSMADRDLAIKDLLQSAFGHSGQKCSACSLAILEKEVYDDLHFRQQLRDAAESLSVGLAWNLSTKINPLIHAPEKALLRALTILEEGEEWLLEPRQDLENPNLWSPGIKLGVKVWSFTHQTELFGPLLGLMRADHLEQAIEWANATPYGLTAGIHSLDDREQQFWLEHIIAGNCYINRTITGAIVRRQPFGGCKESSFGKSAKAGGPNYVIQLMRQQVLSLPKEREPLGKIAMKLNQQVRQTDFSKDELESWAASIGSYAFYWNHYFSKLHDPSRVEGQDNFLRYVPVKDLVLRIQENDSFLDLLKTIVAAYTCGVNLEVSLSDQQSALVQGKWRKCFKDIPMLQIVVESEAQLISRIKSRLVKKIRLLSQPSVELELRLAETACHVIQAPILANGRLELLNFLREVSLSIDYHRYGYLGLRENEVTYLTQKEKFDIPEW